MMAKIFPTVSSVVLASVLSVGIVQVSAEAVENTITFFEAEGYAVRIFKTGKQFKINLYNRQTKTLMLNGEPVTQQQTPAGTAYVHLGNFPVRVLIANDGTQQLRFDEFAEEEPAENANSIEIDSDTAAFSDRTLTSGPIQLKASYTPPGNAADPGDNLQYQLSYAGNQNPAATIQAGMGVYYSGSLSLADLDSDGTSEAIVQGYSGGAHCCTDTLVYSWQDGAFKTLETGYLDGLGGEFTDLDGNGLSEFVSVDNQFLYRFSSYAGSFPPPRILTYKAGNFTETTKQYPAEIRKSIARIEEIFADSNFSGERNGLLAGYVAMKSLVGEYEAGWQYMLERYDSTSDWGLEIRDDKGEEVDKYPDFPTALEAFLSEAGYR